MMMVVYGDDAMSTSSAEEQKILAARDFDCHVVSRSFHHSYLSEN